MKRVLLSNNLMWPQPAWTVRLVALTCVCLMVSGPLGAARAQETSVSNPSAPTTAPTTALTAPPPPDPRHDPATTTPRAALAHYEKGRALYLAGRYREAVGELESALALDPTSANLVYNLARVYELLGEIDVAIRHYKRYRELLPATETAEIARVDGTLQRLEGARGEIVEPTPDPPQPPPLPPERGVADAAFWSLTTLAVGGFAAGGVTGYMALEAERDAKQLVLITDADNAERKQKIDRTNRLALASDISLLVGAVLGTTAILLFALRTKPAKSGPHASVGIDASTKGAFLFLKGRL